MNRRNDISEELESIGSSLAGLPRTMPYSVPAGYFDNFATDTGKIIQFLQEPEVIPAWGKVQSYAVPPGYFEGLAENILAKTASKEALPGMPADAPFAIPAGYFENLPGQVLAAAKASGPVKKTATKIQLGGAYAIRSIRWAAAAMLIIFIGVGGLYYFYQPPTESEKILASVPRNEIQEYVMHTYRIDPDRVANNDISNLHLDNNEIIQYLDETGWDVAE